MTKIEELRAIATEYTRWTFIAGLRTEDFKLLLDYIEAAEAWIYKPAVADSVKGYRKNRDELWGKLQAARRALGLE